MMVRSALLWELMATLSVATWNNTTMQCRTGSRVKDKHPCYAHTLTSCTLNTAQLLVFTPATLLYTRHTAATRMPTMTTVGSEEDTDINVGNYKVQD